MSDKEQNQPFQQPPIVSGSSDVIRTDENKNNNALGGFVKPLII